MIRKPDPVTICMAAFIYLSRKLLYGINLPTLYHRTSSPQAVLYVAFQLARFTRNEYYYSSP